MKWNWQKKEWPNFKYDNEALRKYEESFLKNSGVFQGVLKHIVKEEKKILVADIAYEEAYKTSEIEGEILNRDSLRSSIYRNFGLQSGKRKISEAEEGISNLITDLYRNFANPLSKNTLCSWSQFIIGDKDYRISKEPMQVVSGSIYNPKVHFEAPPSYKLRNEMHRFINWFNSTLITLPPLTRASIVHLYFVCIHPFEDGNGRIARALAEKSLSQNLGRPSLISLSKIIEKNRKKYYSALDNGNKDLEITSWIQYFSETVLEAQHYSQSMVEFLIKKARFFEKNKNILNPRQEKVICRIFEEGIEGFKGGLSAENYISIAKTSRATATRDLQDLVEENILIKTGQLKSTRYYLN